METVEVVIRLPKDIYDIFAKNAETIKANPLSFQTINAVLNGIVLPKNHGRLIDADALQKVMEDNLKAIPMINNTTNEMIRRDERISCIDELRHSQTILDAEVDK